VILFLGDKNYQINMLGRGWCYPCRICLLYGKRSTNRGHLEVLNCPDYSWIVRRGGL